MKKMLIFLNVSYPSRLDIWNEERDTEKKILPRDYHTLAIKLDLLGHSHSKQQAKSASVDYQKSWRTEWLPECVLKGEWWRLWGRNGSSVEGQMMEQEGKEMLLIRHDHMYSEQDCVAVAVGTRKEY